jgi:hypothetical protein
VPGFFDPYFLMNIHGYRAVAGELSKDLAPTPESSPELFWDSGFLRASLTDTADVRRVLAEESKDTLSKLLDQLDRSHVRIIQVEVAGYSRYLNKWEDGTPKLYPLVWAYDHPEYPGVPNGIKAFDSDANIAKSFVQEESTLRWLLGTFLPANPGSRIVGPKDLLRMAQTPVGTEVTEATLAEAVKDWVARSATQPRVLPTFVEAGGKYFSAADLFQLLASALGGLHNAGKLPEKLRLTDIYGPIRLDETEETYTTTAYTPGQIAEVASQLAPKLTDQTWRPVPDNAVPAHVEISGKKILPAQFLALMVKAYQSPVSTAAIRLPYYNAGTAPGGLFPRQNDKPDSGHIWTLRPAPLKLD